MSKNCIVCNDKKIRFVHSVDRYDYFFCCKCKVIFIDAEVIQDIDNGIPLVTYDDTYWKKEIKSSLKRSFGIAIARTAELFYYSRIPILKFLDIGTGTGFFLDAIEKYLPNSKDIFWGIEKFPPPNQAGYRTNSANYVIGDIESLRFDFDAGICIEVIEHMTPNMVNSMLYQLASKSNNGAIYLFNTSLSDVVLEKNTNYLDPIKRGHIVSYSIESIRCIAQQCNFITHPIPGKKFAFLLEYSRESAIPYAERTIKNRIWSPVKHNIDILNDPIMGSVLEILGLESARAYRD